MTIFDLVNDGKPCRYKFQRHLGQKVEFWRTGIVGKIVEIREYYTIVTKKAGFDIKSDTVKVKCRDGSVSYVSRYSMNKKEAKP